MTDKTDRTLVRYGAAALFAAALVVSLTAAQDPSQPGRPGGPRPGWARLQAEIGLTPEQVQAIEKFRQGRREDRLAFRGEIDKLRNEMRALRRDPAADRARVDALIDKGAKLRAERQKRAFRTRAERDKILTPEQREKLRAFRSRHPGRPGFAAPGRPDGPHARGRWHRHPRWRR